MAIPKLAYRTITAGAYHDAVVTSIDPILIDEEEYHFDRTAYLLNWELWNEFGVESRREIYAVLIARREDGAVGFVTQGDDVYVSPETVLVLL